MARVFNTETGARRYERRTGDDPCEICGATTSCTAAYMEITPGPKPRPVGTCGSMYCRDRVRKGAA